MFKSVNPSDEFSGFEPPERDEGYQPETNFGTVFLCTLAAHIALVGGFWGWTALNKHSTKPDSPASIQTPEKPETGIQNPAATSVPPEKIMWFNLAR